MNKEDKEELSNEIDKGIDEYCDKLETMIEQEDDLMKRDLLQEEYKKVCNGRQRKNTLRKNTPH